MNGNTNKELCIGAMTRMENQYSTHFEENFNVDGTPDGIDLEGIFNAPQEHINEIVGYSKYCYRKYGLIMRTINIMRDFGSIQSPQNAFLLNLGLESLHIRMQRHCENALAVARFLQNHEKIAWVNYSQLEGNKYYELAQKYLPNGSCGVVSFGVKGGRAAAETFMKNLKIAAIETHVADARSCCLHPASATHRQMNDQELEAAGISADLVRFSCGILRRTGDCGRPRRPKWRSRYPRVQAPWEWQGRSPSRY
mgnify:CR=1 FL=1